MEFVNGKADLANLIPTVWSTNIYQELRNSLMLAEVFNRDYEGELMNLGDTVKVNQIIAPDGEILTDDKQTFSSERMDVVQQTITVNKRASAAFEFTDLAQLQSMSFERDAQEALLYAIRKKIEEDMISILIPSAANPDHIIAPASASDLAAIDIAKIRTLMSLAKLPRSNRFLFLDPTYYGDLIQKQTIASRDYVPAGSPTMTGLISEPLYGFSIAEHDLLPVDTGYAIHRSACTLVMQQGVRIKISDLHAQNKYGYLLSADIVYGIKLMDDKRIVKISG
jgi:hypothetical protein